MGGTYYPYSNNNYTALFGLFLSYYIDFNEAFMGKVAL